MAKRKSWDEKSKGMHKSRKLIIDTVFGRQDNTQRVFGYEKESEQKREVGEKWVDSDGQEWEQFKGFKSKVTQMDDVRQYLKKLTTCKDEECDTKEYSYADKKTISKTGLCITCLRKLEQRLRDDGTFPFYEDYKVTRNKLDYVRDFKSQLEEALRGVKQQIERPPFELPQIETTGTVDPREWTHDMTTIINYKSHEAIKMNVAV